MKNNVIIANHLQVSMQSILILQIINLYLQQLVIFLIAIQL